MEVLQRDLGEDKYRPVAQEDGGCRVPGEEKRTRIL
jgi:hypothetical protein